VTESSKKKSAPGSASKRLSGAARKPPTSKAGRRAPQSMVLDSSCWLEFFADGPQAHLYAAALDHVEAVVVPVIVLYEVAKKLHREAGDEVAAAALALMHQAQVVPLDTALALEAAVNGLPLADSLIYATARRHGAELWTHDAHFDGLPGVRFFPKE
jgi:toxin FitB